MVVLLQVFIHCALGRLFRLFLGGKLIGRRAQLLFGEIGLWQKVALVKELWVAGSR